MGKVIADLVVLIHWLWVVIMLATVPVIIFNPELKYYALAVSLISIFSWLVRRKCPLTSLELALRNKYAKSGLYKEMFITHYLNKYLHTEFSDRNLRLVIYFYMILAVVMVFVR